MLKQLTVAVAVVAVAVALFWATHKDGGSFRVVEMRASDGSPYWLVGGEVTNAFLLPCCGGNGDGGLLLIDTGYAHEFFGFVKGLSEAGIDVARIRWLFVTHNHDDHSGFAAAVRNVTGCGLIAPKLALTDLADGRWEWHGTGANALVDVVGRLYNAALNRTMRFPPVSLEEPLHALPADGVSSSRDDFARTKLGLAGEFVATPGHTDDSWSLLMDDGRAFVGDAAMNFPGLNVLGVGKRPIFVSSRTQMYRSLALLRSKGAQLILTAHGAPFDAAELPSEPADIASEGPGIAGVCSLLRGALPVFALGGMTLMVAHHSRFHILRMIIYAVLFIFAQRALVAFGFVRIGSEPAPWTRLAADAPSLSALAGLLAICSAAIVWIERRHARFSWSSKRSKWLLLASCAGVSALVLSPCLLLRGSASVGELGGAFPRSGLLWAVLLFALCSCTLEGVLMRGFVLQHLLHEGASSSRASLIMGMLSGFVHITLGVDAGGGVLLLLVSMWQGILLSRLRTAFGLLASIAAHTAILSTFALL